MKRFILAAFMFALVGCSANGPLQRTMNRSTATITWIRTQPVNPGGPLCPPVAINGQWAVTRGCEQTTVDGCTIWLVEPSSATDEKQMAILGHEVLHCFLGDFHPQQLITNHQ